MTLDPVYAYCGQRAVDRKTTTDVVRHALTVWAKLSGAMDAECGAIGVVPMGLWDPGDALNCEKCARIVAGSVAVPEEAAALRQPDKTGTPSLFTAA